MKNTVYTCKYLDSKEIPTIGMGFNLHKNGASQKTESVGGDFDKVSLYQII